MSKRLNQADINQFIDLWKTKTPNEIASHFGVSRTYVYFIAKNIRQTGFPLENKRGDGQSLTKMIRSMMAELGYKKGAKQRRKRMGVGISKRILSNSRVMPFVEMAVGGVMNVERDAWGIKSSPTVYLGNYRRRLGMNWATKTLTTGWEVKRLK